MQEVSIKADFTRNLVVYEFPFDGAGSGMKVNAEMAPAQARRIAGLMIKAAESLEKQ